MSSLSGDVVTFSTPSCALSMPSPMAVARLAKNAEQNSAAGWSRVRENRQLGDSVGCTSVQYTPEVSTR